MEVIGGLWGGLGGLGRLLGRLWGGIGEVWGGLGRLLGRLGPAWVHLCENDALAPASGVVSVSKKIPRWGYLGAQTELIWTKIDFKNEDEKRSS